MLNSVILVVDDERRFPNHPERDIMIFASSAKEAIALLTERKMVCIKEIWLDFVIIGNIVDVMTTLKTIAQEDPDFAKSVLLRTCTGSFSCAETLKEWLSQYYTFGDPAVE